MRVFLDTNVLVSAFVARGLCSDIFRIILAEHDLILSTYILSELKFVLDKKIKLPLNQIESILKYLRSFELIDDHTPPKNIDIRDKSDLPVISAALNGQVDILITGDKDLLELNQTLDIRIVNPREFLKIIRT